MTIYFQLMEDLAKVMPPDQWSVWIINLGRGSCCAYPHMQDHIIPTEHMGFSIKVTGLTLMSDDSSHDRNDLKARNQINLTVKLMKLVLGLNVHLRSSSHVINLQDWHVKETLRTNYHWFSSSQCSSLVKHNSFYLQIQG